jgi:hypothetical protein
MKLKVSAFGLALGIVWGGAMFLLGVVDIFTTWGDAWGAIMSTIYIGYSPTFLGSIIGGVWGFCDAGIGGVIVAWLYNKLAG